MQMKRKHYTLGYASGVCYKDAINFNSELGKGMSSDIHEIRPPNFSLCAVAATTLGSNTYPPFQCFTW